MNKLALALSLLVSAAASADVIVAPPATPQTPATKDAKKPEEKKADAKKAEEKKPASKEQKPAEKAAEKALDFVFTLESGEASRDSSHHSSTWTVQGTKAHYTYRYSGRNSGMHGTEDKDVDGVLNDPAAIQALLDAFDKTPTTSKMPTKFQDTRYETACIKRGKVERCIGALGGRNWDAPRAADFAALDALMAALMEQMKVPL